MALEISTTQATGMTLAATIERLSDGYFWNPTAVAFQSAPAWADKDIALTEGIAENVGTYTASVASLGSPGACRVRIHDTASSNATIAAGDVYVSGGNEVVQTGDSYAVVASGTHGNAALKTLVDGVKTKTDSLTFTTANKVDAKLTSDGLDSIATTAPTGVASNFREMLVQVWRRFFKKVEYSDSGNTIKTYADDGATVVTTQTATSTGGTETQGAAT